MSRSPRQTERLQDAWLGFYLGVIVGALVTFSLLEVFT